MDRAQHIEFLTALLQELDEDALFEVQSDIAYHLTNLQYVIIYDKIEEKYKRAEAIEKHVEKFTEMLKREED